MTTLAQILAFIIGLTLPFGIYEYSQPEAIGGEGTIRQLDQWRSTTTPFVAITTNTPGANLYLPLSSATASALTATTLCLTGDDCITEWPVGGAGGGGGMTVYIQNGGATLNAATTTLNFTPNSFTLVEDPTDTFAIRVATTTLGLLTTNVSEGSNLYYTDARVSTYMSASSTYTNLQSFYTTPSGRITAGDGLTWSSNTLNFDGGNTPAGALGGTWASPTVDNDGHSHTGATLSGIDISDDTNLTVTATGLQLSADAIALAATYFLPTTTRAATWDLAHSWGNHATQGYLTGITGQSIEDLSDVTSFTQAGQDLFYYNGSAWDRLPKGANGEVLLTNASGNLDWVATSTLGLGGAGGGGLATSAPWVANELVRVASDGEVTSIATSSLGLSPSFTTSAGLASLLSDETGTGNTVFSASPAFSGSVNIADTSAGATTTPLILVNNSGTLNTATELRFAPSNATSSRYSSIAAINNGTNGIDLSFITGNGAAISEKMRITRAGNVGIATTTPAELFTVAGASFFTGSSSKDIVKINQSGTGNALVLNQLSDAKAFSLNSDATTQTAMTVSTVQTEGGVVIFKNLGAHTLNGSVFKSQQGDVSNTSATNPNVVFENYGTGLSQRIFNYNPSSTDLVEGQNYGNGYGLRLVNYNTGSDSITARLDNYANGTSTNWVQLAERSGATLRAFASTTQATTTVSIQNYGSGSSLVVDTMGSGNSAIFNGGNVGIGTTTPAQLLSVAGGMHLTGALYDRVYNPGTNGMVLQTTGSGVQWVATSTLGISGVTTIAGLSDVNVTGAASGTVLVYDGATWQSRATSTLSIDLANTTGILGATRGGTGLSSVTQNQLLIGGAGNSWAQIATSSLGLSSAFSNSSGLAALLSDETGSGNSVFSTSPNFTGQVQFTQTSAGATTVPLLLVNNSSAANTVTALRFAPSSATSSRYSEIRATNDGANAIDLLFVTGNGATINEKMRVGANGLVGIGTTTPAEELDVNGTIIVGNNQQLQMRGSTGQISSLRTVGTQDITFRVASGDRMSIASSGNVGIGTTTPSSLLQTFSTGTSTISIDSNSTSKGSCIEMKDRSGVGYTYITAEDGVLTASTVSCK